MVDHGQGVRVVLPGTRLLLAMFSVLTFVAFVTLFVQSSHTDHYFAWTISLPVTAAFLGAAYGSGCVLVVLALRAGSWSRVRVPFVTVLVFTLVTLLHSSLFHFGEPDALARVAAWLWLAVYVLVPIGMLAMLLRQERRPEADPPKQLPLPRGLAAVLVVLARYAEVVRWGSPAAWGYVVTVASILLSGLYALRRLAAAPQPRAYR